ncbi:MAG: spore coat protein [Carboxydocellales bacterium]
MSPMLTQKELWALEDNLSRERFLVSKFCNYAQQLSDPGLQELCIQVAQKHRQHYHAMLQQLNTQQMAGF